MGDMRMCCYSKVCIVSLSMHVCTHATGSTTQHTQYPHPPTPPPTHPHTSAIAHGMTVFTQYHRSHIPLSTGQCLYLVYTCIHGADNICAGGDAAPTFIM